MKRKILIVNMDFPPIGGPGVQRILKFTKYLTEDTWSVTVVASKKSWASYDYSLCQEIPTGVKVHRISWYSVEEASRIIAIGISLLFLPLRLVRMKQDKIIGGFNWRIRKFMIKVLPELEICWIVKGFIQVFKIYNKDKFDIILTSGPPHSSHIIGLIFKFFTGVKWITDFRDPWSDNKDDCSIWRGHTLARFLVSFKEKLVLERCDASVTVSKCWKKLFLNKLVSRTNSDIKFHIIYNGYDEEDLLSLTRTKKYPSSFHLHYNGTIYQRRNCEYFFQSIRKVIEKNNIPFSEIQCTFTGIPKKCLDYVYKIDLGDVIKDLGRLGHIQSITYSYNADVLLLVSDKFDKTSLGAMTGKVYEYIAMGKPILALLPKEGELAEFLSKYNNAKIVEYDDVQGISQAIEEFIRQKNEGKLVFSNKPDWITQYSRKNQTFQLSRLMEELITKT